MPGSAGQQQRLMTKWIWFILVHRTKPDFYQTGETASCAASCTVHQLSMMGTFKSHSESNWLHRKNSSQFIEWNFFKTGHIKTDAGPQSARISAWTPLINGGVQWSSYKPPLVEFLQSRGLSSFQSEWAALKHHFTTGLTFTHSLTHSLTHGCCCPARSCPPY